MNGEVISDSSGSPPHLEPVNDDPSGHITPAGVDTQDGKQSLTLHHNSRRRRRGSAVVLNAKKMQKILEGQSESDSTSYFEYEIASTMNRIEIPQMKLNAAFSIFQKKWRAHHHSQIQQNLEKTPPGGVVGQSTADRIFALILGWRIRLLFKSRRIKRSVDALNDVYKVLMEVMVATPTSPSSSSGAGVSREESKYAANRFYMFKSICLLSKNRSMENTASSSSGKEIPYADRVLVDHLIKETLLMRAMIQRTLFEDVVWSSLQSRAINNERGALAEGFWDFTAPVKIVLSAANAINDQAAANSSSSAAYNSPIRRGNSPIRSSPGISRSASAAEGEVKQRQEILLETFDKPYKPNGAKQNAPVSQVNGDGMIRKIATLDEFTEPPLFESSSSSAAGSRKGSEKLCSSLNETGDSVIQLDLASLRALTQRKKSVTQSESGLVVEEEYIVEGGKLGQRSKVRGVVKKAPGSASASASKAVPADKAEQSESIRPENTRACIQLDIIRADRLMPAKKGSVARDAYGNAVPDRKPCLQISLLMPAAGPSPLKSKRPRPGGGNNNNTNVSVMDSDDEDDEPYGRSEELKRIHHISKEYSEVTLNPRWKDSEKKDGGSTFYLPLPCPKKVILSDRSASDVMVSESISDFSFSVDTESSSNLNGLSAMEKERELSYQRACKALLAHWGQGLVKIQIIDGERFNEDIFLGEITLRLASFFVPQASISKKAVSGTSAEASNAAKSSPQYEVSGTYQLCKAKASDRVSGSLTLHAYLHLPDISYVEAVRATAPQHFLLQHQSIYAPPQRRHTAAARVAWSDPSSATDRRGASQNDVIPPPHEAEDLESSPISNEWDDDDDDPLELSFAPHSPKVVESPDRRLFRHRPAVCSFGVHGHHGPDSKSKIRIAADGSSLQVHSDLQAGSTKLGLNFHDESEDDVNSDGEAEDRDEFDPSGAALTRQTCSNRSASKLAAKRSVPSSSAVSINRRSMLDGVSKCLDGLSVAQDGADSYLERMQKRLEGMRNAKEGEKSPQRSKSESCIPDEKMKISIKAVEAFPVDMDQKGPLTPTRKKKKSEKDIEKENKAESDKIEVCKAVKVAAKSNFLSLSPAPSLVLEPCAMPDAVGPSPFRDVTDTSNTTEIETETEADGADDGPQSPDSSEMIVVTSEGYTITRSSSGVAHMTSNPSSPFKKSTPKKKRSPKPKTDQPMSISLFDPSSSPTSPPESPSASDVDNVVISEGWRKRNVERGKLSAASSPVRNG